MKFLKIKKALLLALTLLTALQTVTITCMEKQEKNWGKSIFSTISSLYKKKSSKKLKAEKNLKIEQEEKIEKNEKIEKEEETSGSGYTASMIHLLTMAHSTTNVRPEKITLSPEPSNQQKKKTWFWSNGVLSQKKTVYTVHYKGVDYISTYSSTMKAWKAPYENQMDYFT